MADASFVAAKSPSPLERPALHQYLHRLPARERASRPVPRARARLEAVGESLRKAEEGESDSKINLSDFEMDFSETGR